MQDILDPLKTLVLGVWLHRWVAVLIAWLICLMGWPFALKFPDQYQSQAKIYVDTQSLLAPLLRGLTIQTNPTQQIQLIVKTLFTRPNLEKIARLADLDIKAKDNTEFDLIIAGLQSGLKLNQAGRDNIYHIAYTSSSANEAKNVVQATLTTLVENTLGDNRKDSDIAADFIDRQIAEYATRLNEADNRLKEFKKANFELMSNDGYYSRVQSLKATIAGVNLELNEARIRFRSASQQLAGEQPTFGLMQDSFTPQFGVRTSFDNRIDSLENNLDELRLKYTEIHPDIKETQRIIDDLKRKRDIELQERHKETALIDSQRGDRGLNENPVYQELKLTRAREQSNVSSLQVRLSTYNAQLKELESKINSIPDIEAELKALDRGYQITQQKHNELMSRRESAHLSQQADASSNSFQFRIIDPPRTPSVPIGPNRPLFISGVLAASLAAGIGMAFLISQLRPVFFSSKQLNAVTGVPVLGSVSVYSNQVSSRRNRKQGVIFILLLVGLLGSYSAILVLQLFPDLNNQVTALLPDMPSQFNALYLKTKLLIINLINRF
ncbi:MAG: polysaccharide chain length determinant protein (PEP-CTERM system associated) [Motiliproteus sp.]|jgi:polysaccharide chain length determinant protein (PEP-CTERM system associated)